MSGESWKDKMDIPKVEDMAVAIVKEKNEKGEEEWSVYLLNLKDKEIEGVLVSSKGYGKIEEEKRQTSMLRHYLGEMKPKSYKKIEPIVPEVFGLSNEYWVSFFEDNKMHDKKYIFLAGVIEEANFTSIPLMNKKGVLIR